MNGTSDPQTTPYGESYVKYQVKPRNLIRKYMRSFYLKEIVKHVDGPAIDFGCGTGELLARLPPGSMGLEINPAAVQFCREKGMDVILYDGKADGYSLSFCKTGGYSALILSHVLEHLDDPADALRRIMLACAALAIGRIVVVVPGKRGFAFDATHRTFVNKIYLERHGLVNVSDYRIIKQYYFPFNMEWVGTFFTYHELHVVFAKRSPTRISV